jgi:hypothetical protein
MTNTPAQALPKEIEEAIELFDECAKKWGWAEDQGYGPGLKESEDQYFASRSALRSIISAAIEIGYATNCHVCKRIIDTREEKDGGDKFGAEITTGVWVCSPECWDAIVEDNTPAALQSHKQSVHGEEAQ